MANLVLICAADSKSKFIWRFWNWGRTSKTIIANRGSPTIGSLHDPLPKAGEFSAQLHLSIVNCTFACIPFSTMHL